MTDDGHIGLGQAYELVPIRFRGAGTPSWAHRQRAKDQDFQHECRTHRPWSNGPSLG
ncbi:hypothetical protein [Paenarthrobacter sp. NPDC018779]|uniref:hypothetical protein n=1 Tax=Paenarthrobacter sp. NPDC018779 TaxID=3364375 RepID=UPI0037C63AAE